MTRHYDVLHWPGPSRVGGLHGFADPYNALTGGTVPFGLNLTGSLVENLQRFQIKWPDAETV
jgi:hypothetical protein